MYVFLYPDKPALRTYITQKNLPFVYVYTHALDLYVSALRGRVVYRRTATAQGGGVPVKYPLAAHSEVAFGFPDIIG